MKLSSVLKKIGSSRTLPAIALLFLCSSSAFGLSQPLGDVTGDGYFNSSDLVKLFSKGNYANGSPSLLGDVNYDGVFDSGDLREMFASGGYNSPYAFLSSQPVIMANFTASFIHKDSSWNREEEIHGEGEERIVIVEYWTEDTLINNNGEERKTKIHITWTRKYEDGLVVDEEIERETRIIIPGEEGENDVPRRERRERYERDEALKRTCARLHAETLDENGNTDPDFEPFLRGGCMYDGKSVNPEVQSEVENISKDLKDLIDELEKSYGDNE